MNSPDSRGTRVMPMRATPPPAISCFISKLMKQPAAGGGVALIGMQLIPLLANLFG